MTQVGKMDWQEWRRKDKLDKVKWTIMMLTFTSYRGWTNNLLPKFLSIEFKKQGVGVSSEEWGNVFPLEKGWNFLFVHSLIFHNLPLYYVHNLREIMLVIISLGKLYVHNLLWEIVFIFSPRENMYEYFF